MSIFVIKLNIIKISCVLNVFYIYLQRSSVFLEVIYRYGVLANYPSLESGQFHDRG